MRVLLTFPLAVCPQLHTSMNRSQLPVDPVAMITRKWKDTCVLTAENVNKRACIAGSCVCAHATVTDCLNVLQQCYRGRAVL
jgi:hypothetical protein